MKKLIATTALAMGIISATTGLAMAADSIDYAGRAAVAIAAPSFSIAHTAGRQVGFDSAGKFTAAYPKAVSLPHVTALDLTGVSHACLDSSCRTELKM